MVTSAIVIEVELARCIKNYADDRCCLLELLRFLGRHPYTRFSRSAVVHALKNQGVFVERGLKYLVERGVVTTETENKISLYSLTGDGPIRNWALDLVRLDWLQWQLLLKQIVPAE